ncbi:MAG TPA: lysoplasmalogenase [Polyangiales bacterium]|nr:lysoplasmalogenase [Polyangiales bacterium]
MTLAAALTGLAVCALLVAEWRGWRIGIWIAKPLASLGFVAVALLGGASSTVYGSRLLVGLCLCLVGDGLLIPPGNGKAFLLGIGSFALGHVAYAWAFLVLDPQPWPSVIALAVMAVIVGSTLRWLGPHLPADMRVPVRVYMLVIATMVALAVGASATRGGLELAIGAAAFAASDLSVARERFVRPSLVNLLWGLPLYYAAQLVLAKTAVSGP